MLSVTERRFHFRGKKYSKMCLKINWYLKTTLIFVFHGRRKHRWSRTSTTERWIQPFALPKCFYLFCLKEGKSFLGFFSLSFEGAFICSDTSLFLSPAKKLHLFAQNAQSQYLIFTFFTYSFMWLETFSIDAQFVICLFFRHRWLHFIPLPAWS